MLGSLKLFIYYLRSNAECSCIDLIFRIFNIIFKFEQSAQLPETIKKKCFTDLPKHLTYDITYIL